MNKEIKQKWIEALRSGDYEQGRCALRTERPNGVNTYCCLGVLADVIDNTKWILKQNVQYMDNKIYAYADGEHSGYLNDEVLDKVELTYDDQMKLASFNDKEGRFFHEIADYIENNL